MGKTVARRDPRDIEIAGLTLTATGIEGELSAPPPVDGFRNAMSFIERVGGSMNWWKGDLANLAETWGDEYVQLLDELGDSESAIAKMAWVSASVPYRKRFRDLSWSHHLVVAGLPSDDQKRLLSMARPEEGGKDPRKSVPELKELVRELKLRIERERHPLPHGQYRVLYADPPWKYNDELIEGYGAAEHHYPTLAIDELCGLADATGKTVAATALPDAALFMWATSPLLQDAFAVIEAWGFQYKTSFVWDKVKHNYGHYNSVRHELLLVATRGSCVPDAKTLRDSVVECERDDKHSRKPAIFYEIIEEMYTSGARLELFAREPRHGWDAWGNEAG